MHPKTLDPSAGVLVQFLRWVAERPRTYAETMDAWRTSCPRLSVWEDAVLENLVVAVHDSAAAQGGMKVVLTPAGEALLRGKQAD